MLQDTAIFVAAPDHLLTASVKINAYELEGQSFILTEAKSGYSLKLLEQLQSLNGKDYNIMEFSSLEAIKQCVMNGLKDKPVDRVVLIRF